MTSGSGLLRVTVVSGDRRADLAVPGDVPVVELLPALSAHVVVPGRRDATVATRLVTAGGRVLEPSPGLTGQGVMHGAVLALVGDADPPPRYDDVVEALASLAEPDLAAPTPRRTTWCAAAGLLLLGTASAALAGRTSAPLLLAAAAVLLAGALVLRRCRGDPHAAVATALLACAPAGAVGAQLGGSPASGAGAALLAVAAVAACVLEAGRVLLAPPVVLGAVLVVAPTVPADVAVVLTGLLVLTVLAAEGLPWLAVAVSIGFDDVSVSPERPPDPAGVDLERLRAGVGRAGEILVAGSASVGLVLVALAPVAVSAGLPGAATAVLCVLVVVLRGRLLPAGARATCLASGLLGLASAAVAACWLHPSWRAAEAALLLVVGGAGLARVLVGRGPTLREERLCEAVRSAALVALPSALVAASGVLPALVG